MRLAVIADVHSNLPALRAVLDEIEELAPDRVVCLGDLVGYNAQPSECIEEVLARCDIVVAGNHDVEATSTRSAAGTNAAARHAIDWTRAQLTAAERQELERLPVISVEPEFVAVHGSYLSDAHFRGYVTSTMLDENLEVVRRRSEWPKLALCGHTHVPMCGYSTPDGVTEAKLHAPVEWERSSCVLVNPGAVGQPRDGDPRAAFAMVNVEERRVEVHRVAYDIAQTVAASRDAGLPDSLAMRLWEGR